MPTKSTSKSRFKNETEEADWLASPAGRRAVTRKFQDAVRNGTIVVDEPISLQKATALARSGNAVVVRKGSPIKATGSAKLAEIVAEAHAAMTQAVSLRIPRRDLDAAKRVAEKKGVGYQTVLKEIIRKGLRQA
jgi:predicted DNA binding CopG/RHH family protein